MNDPQPISPRRRLQELLAIPERLRTEAQWDELNELEITLAAANRTDSQERNVRRNAPSGGEQAKPGGSTQAKKPFKKFPKKPPKGNPPA